VSFLPLPFRTELDRRFERGGSLRATGGVLLVAGLATLFAAVVDVVFGASEHDIVILFGINAVLVVGLQAFVGNTGIMSFGNVAFMGVGAYAAGVVAVPVAQKAIFLADLPSFLKNSTLPVVPALLVGGLAAAALGVLFGPLVVRLPESAATIVTFGILVVMNNVFQNATSFTRGNQTFIGVPQKATFGLVFGSLAAVVALSAAFKWSPLGLRARCVREDPIAAEASGVRVSTARLWPFALSAFISGVGGALWAFEVTAFSPNSFYIAQSIGAIAMMILGGYRSVSGSLVGATVMTIWLELIRHVENGFSAGPIHVRPLIGISQLSLGVALVLVLRWRPAGVLGSREVELGQRPSHRSDDPGAAS
jgi:branched-chain amino acid transport system permease protein